MATGATGTDSVARSPLNRRETILEPPFFLSDPGIPVLR